MPRTQRYNIAATPRKSPKKIPLNDDRQEKTNRLHERAKQQDGQYGSIRASATPARRLASVSANSPHTPILDQDGIGSVDVTGTAITPMKRTVPLLANFEEWMKLATDNKINATNSWNFALIDYFHDMSLLKEGDGVNFQKASCTLDGCVKIYTSRVDSVATDTGKLLSGLAESGNKKRRGEDVDGEEDGEDGEDDGEDGQKRRKKKTHRAEATLATDFAQLRNKKMELELSVDPLFKKASADFDEGGAKGLLLNHLAIDAQGRIVFDSSDDAQDASAVHRQETPYPDNPEEMQPGDEDGAMEGIEAQDDAEVDISILANKYFPNLTDLDGHDICPSLKTFDLGDANGSTDLPFLKAPEDNPQDNEDGEEGNRSGILLDEENAMGFDDDDDADMAGFDMPPETGFGDGGEVWAKEAARDPQIRLNLAEGTDEGAGDGGLVSEGTTYGISMAHSRVEEHENVLAYFDVALKKNWAGPEHWRIRRIKDVDKVATTVKRKEKEPFEIDFAAPMSQATADALFTPATSNSTITLPKAQWKSKSKNLLPDDKHFNSKQLLRLFLKPKARLGARREGNRKIGQQNRAQEDANGEVGAEHWASQGNEAAAEETVVQGDYPADFFQDDGLGGGPPDEDDDAFADARDHFSPPPGEGAEQIPSLGGVLSGLQEGAFGTQLVTQSRRFRPEYVQYAKVAKKVDIRRLKDELWRGIGFDNTKLSEQSAPAEDIPSEGTDGTLKFTQVMNSLQTVYKPQAIADISTSYCFICLLHLANEKGLVIENQENLEDLSIRRDFTADLSIGD
ncbi:barren [Amniculicola lignicola CBS 123094]|uniref:Condensin complex subunit 2 n=1 Tax=Amniculicola lignicola CBS 123094 TaxID=1392246 RepID=A0A6A5WAF6_9PLEO|nr:barren [Amniculicola lignicola CBS 123094]